MLCKSVHLLFLLGGNISVIDFADPGKQYDTTIPKYTMYEQLPTNDIHMHCIHEQDITSRPNNDTGRQNDVRYNHT